MSAPRWIVYARQKGDYPVALDSAFDWDHYRETLQDRLLPGPIETIRCSSLETAQRIADWLNARMEEEA